MKNSLTLRLYRIFSSFQPRSKDSRKARSDDHDDRPEPEVRGEKEKNPSPPEPASPLDESLSQALETRDAPNATCLSFIAIAIFVLYVGWFTQVRDFGKLEINQSIFIIHVCVRSYVRELGMTCVALLLLGIYKDRKNLSLRYLCRILSKTI